jgi:DNA-binding Lrp family transcriptional regulator
MNNDGRVRPMAKIDELDYKILRELQKDCRILQEIADNVGGKVSTVHYRVKRLEKEGVIRGYSARLDANKLDLSFQCIIHVYAKHGPAFEDMGLQIAQIKGVSNVYWAYGEVDFFVLARARDRAEYNSIIRRIMNIQGVDRTSSHVIARVVKENPLLDI